MGKLNGFLVGALCFITVGVLVGKRPPRVIGSPVVATGFLLGILVGRAFGLLLGVLEGALTGFLVGAFGLFVGAIVGLGTGRVTGFLTVGFRVGLALGTIVGFPLVLFRGITIGLCRSSVKTAANLSAAIALAAYRKINNDNLDFMMALICVECVSLLIV